MLHKDVFVTYKMIQPWRLDEGDAVVLNEAARFPADIVDINK